MACASMTRVSMTPMLKICWRSESSAAVSRKSVLPFSSQRLSPTVFFASAGVMSE